MSATIHAPNNADIPAINRRVWFIYNRPFPPSSGVLPCKPLRFPGYCPESPMYSQNKILCSCRLIILLELLRWGKKRCYGVWEPGYNNCCYGLLPVRPRTPPSTLSVPEWWLSAVPATGSMIPSLYTICPPARNATIYPSVQWWCAVPPGQYAMIYLPSGPERHPFTLSPGNGWLSAVPATGSMIAPLNIWYTVYLAVRSKEHHHHLLTLSVRNGGCICCACHRVNDEHRL